MNVEFVKPTYPLQTVLELACAADRVNNGYVKTIEGVFASDAQLVAYRIPNRELMLFTLGEIKPSGGGNSVMQPTLLCTNLADRDLATEIKKFFRRLIFTAIAGEDQFRVDLNAVLNSDEIASNKFGFIACLPSMYRREYAKHQMEKLVSTLEPGYLADVDTQLMDLDCEILEVTRSKNFDAWNVSAIIQNHMVSWMGKAQPNLGACVIIKAKVKAHSTHWKDNYPVTRLNYVKVFQ